MPVTYELGSIVWTKLGQNWWPGRVGSIDDCPEDYTSDLKKKPFAVIKFFNESGFHEVSREDLICSYNCSRKEVYIKKGIRSVQSDASLKEKFEADVVMAEKLTGGSADIIKEITAVNTQKKIDYSELGFGVPKPRKNTPKDQVVQRRGFSNIGEAIQYKRKSSPINIKAIEYKSKILEQPKVQNIEEDMKNCGDFKCYKCGFTTSRVNVIIWHNKSHIHKVADFAYGLVLPKKRKRKANTAKNKDNRSKVSVMQDQSVNAKVNGHAFPLEKSMNANELLQDWDDEDAGNADVEMGDDGTSISEQKEPSSNDLVPNGEKNMNKGDAENQNDSSDDFEDDDDYEGYSSQPRDRLPMPKQVDINSAFDALLAESPSVNNSYSYSSNNNTRSYANNASDSDEDSDWDKYFSKDKRDHSDEESSLASCSEPPKVGEDSGRPESQTPKTVFKKSSTTVGLVTKTSASASQLIQVQDSSCPSFKQSSTQVAEKDSKLGESSATNSSESSTSSSGPAYMLVAVDSQGNNVPMPVLNEGGSHLVAVEASMEDGTTRTLYIDPAHLGPNVDLNNLMLHIDNSGQETVIIPTSSSDSETTFSIPVESSSSLGSSANVVDSSEGTSSTYVKATVDGTIERPKISALPFIKPDTAKAGSEPPKKVVGKQESKTLPPEQSETIKKVLPETGEEIEHTKSGEADGHTEKGEAVGHTEKGEAVGNTGKGEADGHTEKGEAVGHTEKPEDCPTKGPEVADVSSSTKDAASSLESVKKSDKFSCDEIVWVETHGLLWPSYIVEVMEDKNEATILMINCQQKKPLVVDMGRMKHFSRKSYGDIYNSQKGKAAGLSDAMSVAEKFLYMKEKKSTTDLKPKEFFSKPNEVQKSLIDKFCAKSRSSTSKNKKTSPKSHSSPTSSRGSDKHSSSSSSSSRKKHDSKSSSFSTSSGSESRREKMDRYVNYIRSDECWLHLKRVFRSKTSSQRHDFFMENVKKPNFAGIRREIFNCGDDFFGREDSDQIRKLGSTLRRKFDKYADSEFKFDSTTARRYAQTVLLPEAIKHALKTIAKLPDGELESALKNGLSRTERKKTVQESSKQHSFLLELSSQESSSKKHFD